MSYYLVGILEWFALSAKIFVVSTVFALEFCIILVPALLACLHPRCAIGVQNLEQLCTVLHALLVFHV